MKRPAFPTAKMATALYALRRAPIDYTPEGWFSRAGELSSSPDGAWNSHTLVYLAKRGLVMLTPKATAVLTWEGRQYLEQQQQQQGWAA